jgi:hypothetical protein
MPVAKKKEVEIRAVNPDADVHHMIRRVGVQSGIDGTRSVDEVDQDVRNWLQAGYALKFVHSLGLEPNGVNILYIFVKE